MHAHTHSHHTLTVDDVVVLHQLLTRILGIPPHHPISEREAVEVGKLRAFLTKAGRLPGRQP